MDERSIRRTKLLQMQALPLEEKVRASMRRIQEWLEAFPDAKVSFSGGKDSTVLLHIARRVKPDIQAVFADTGLEYPEIRAFVARTPNVQIVKPKLSFLEVVQKYGYPLISKRMAQMLGEAQRTSSDYLRSLRLTGIQRDGTLRQGSKISNKWQFLADPSCGVKISDQCCKHLKKNPMDAIGHAPIVGTMAADSNQRLEMFYRHSCNAFDLTRPRSAPLSFCSNPIFGNISKPITYNTPVSTTWDTPAQAACSARSVSIWNHAPTDSSVCGSPTPSFLNTAWTAHSSYAEC